MGKSRKAVAWGLSLAVVGGIAVSVPSAIRYSEIEASRARDCAAVSKWVESRGEFVIAGSGSQRVTVIGDSYTAGEKLSDRSKGWVFDLAHDENWTVLADGIGKTGFTNGGFCGNQAFSTRTESLLKLAPETVLVQGGLNDTGAAASEVTAAADALLEDLKSVPDVVVVGPVRAPGRPGVESVDAALSAAAERHSRQYVSTLGWDLPFLGDQLHLTEAGHSEYAQRIAASLAG